MNVDVSLGTMRRRWTAVGTAVTVAIWWLIGTMGSPQNLFANGPLTSNFFDLQMHRLLEGHLSVPRGSLGVEGFVMPHGEHMYFGIFPALLRLPVLAFTNTYDTRLGLLSQLLAVIVMCSSVARLARLAEVLFEFDDAPAGWYAVLAMVPVLLSPVLFLSANTWVYHEAILWGAAAAVWGFVVLLRWWLRPSVRNLLVLIAVGVVALGSRPSTGLVPIVGMVTCAMLLLYRRQVRQAVVVAASAVGVFATYAVVNFSRFGQVFGAPFDHQVSYVVNIVQRQAFHDTGGSLLSPAYFVSTAQRYFSPFPGVVRFGRLFPFVTWGSRPAPAFSSTHMYIESTGSLLTSAPVLLLLAGVGIVFLARWRGCRTWGLLLPAALVPVVSTMAYFAMCHRYLVDLVPMLVVLGLPGFWVVRRWFGSRRPLVRRSLFGLVVVVALMGGLTQTSLAVWSHHLYLLPSDEEQVAFIKFQYELDSNLFSSRAPDVRRYDGALAPDHLGSVVVVGACDEVFVRTIFRWVPVERRAGGPFRRVVISSNDTLARLSKDVVPVAHGEIWYLESRPEPGGAAVRFVYRHPGAPDAVSEPVPLDGAPLVVDLVADPVEVAIRVTVRGRNVLTQWPVPAGNLTIEPGWTPLSGGAPFCRLVSRHLPPVPTTSVTP
jgi:hypothetical protein